MNQEIKQKWIEALRSGKYRQGQGCLKRELDGVRHCCLGVLCEVCGFEQDKEYSEQDKNYSEFSFLVNGVRYTSSVPNHVLQHNIQVKLMCMNDTEELSFNQIADYIEKEL